ncbi:MAG: glycine cleavage system protein GcvH [Myxococcota bacterium]
MSNIPDNLKYRDSHEWVRVDGDVATVGISDFAQDSLGDVVYIDMPEVGATVSAGDSIAEIESVKAVSDIYAPVSGEITEINDALEGAEDTVNSAPYEGGWLFRIAISDASELDALLDAEAYKTHIES